MSLNGAAPSTVPAVVTPTGGLLRPAQFPARERTITLSLSVSWPASAPPTAEDLPALQKFMRAVREMAGVDGVAVRGVPQLERVIKEVGGDSRLHVEMTESEFRQVRLAHVMSEERGNRVRAARRLGVSRKTLRVWLRQYAMETTYPATYGRPAEEAP